MAAPTTGQVATWIGTTDNEWSWQDPTGGGGSLPYNGVQIFVSQISGNDSNSGSYSSPLATIGAAITLASTATSAITINVIDGATYTGNFVINNVYLSIVAPYAIFTASSGNIFTISDNGSQHLLSLGLLNATGSASALAMNGTSSVLLRSIVIGNVTNSSASSSGNLFISGEQLAGNFNAPSSGSIRYITQLRLGTDSGATSGLTLSGSNAASFTIKNLISDSLAYPTADGAPGQAIVTNGANVLSFATVGLSWNTISGTSQLAAVNNGYIPLNSSQTVITFPDTCAAGDLISIAGQGSGGFRMIPGSGQTLDVGTSSSATGFDSANASDSVQWICTAANTTWRTLGGPQTSGFTPV